MDLNNTLRKLNIRNKSNYAVLRGIAIFSGATTLNITTFSIKKFNIKTFSINTFSIKTFNIKTFSMAINPSQHSA